MRRTGIKKDADSALTDIYSLEKWLLQTDGGRHSEEGLHLKHFGFDSRDHKQVGHPCHAAFSGQDENNRCLAAEANGFAVGLAGFTADVDINLLNNCFDLEKYDFLVDPEYMEKIKTTMVNVAERRSLFLAVSSFSVAS